MSYQIGLSPTGERPPHSPAGHSSAAPTKWDLLRVVEQSREALGLRGTSVAILRAMISLIKGEVIAPSRPDGHICFASNATLAERAHVSVQTVERHLARLIALGLLERQASGNGKRWARRNAAGQVVLVSGLSLLPLLTRHGELTATARAAQETRDRLRLLVDRCRLALARLRDMAGDLPLVQALLAGAAKSLRRKPKEAPLTALLADILGEIEAINAGRPVETRGNDTQDEGQKETNIIQFDEKTLDHAEPQDVDMETAFPRLCSDLRHLQTRHACARKLDEIAAHLSLGPIWHRLRELGPALSFMILGNVYENIDRLRNPAGYANSLGQRCARGEIGSRQLMRTRAAHQQRSDISLPAAPALSFRR